MPGNAAKGGDKTQMCQGCHGIEGWHTAFPEVYHVPKIGGQHEAYLVKALQEYKSGERSPSVDARRSRHRSRTRTWPISPRTTRRAASRRRGNDDERNDVDPAFSRRRRGDRRTGRGAPASAADLAAGKAKATEVCAACHGVDGNSSSPDFPKLGGQYGDYLAKALRDYKSGQRKNAIMAGFAQALSKQDIENLAAYYSAQPATVSFKH